MMSMTTKSRLPLHGDLIYPSSIPCLSSGHISPSPPSHPLSNLPYSYKTTSTHPLSTSPDTANHQFTDYDYQHSQSCHEKEDSQLMDTTPSASPSTSSSSSSPTSPPLSPTSNFSAMELHYLYDQYQYPSPQTFDAIVQDYLQNLSTKKRDKALVDQQRYALILQVLKDPRNTAISTAQFRFWVKKMFQLSSIKVESQQQNQPSITWVVCHDGKPVATQEQIYPILIRAHRDAHHGGRDKTSALVRKQYSWVPKELIARFVRRCPFCISRRNGHLSRPSRQHISNHLNHQATLPKATKSSINKSASCFDHQSALKSNSLTNRHQNQYHHHHHHHHHHQHTSTHPYHHGDRGISSTKSQQPASTWDDSLHQPEQSFNSTTPTMVASIATTAAASAVSTQWMEPGTPFYYYSQPASRDFFVSGTEHAHNSVLTNGDDYSYTSSSSSSYLGSYDGTRNNSFASVDTAPAVMYTGSSSTQSSSTHSSPSMLPSIPVTSTAVPEQQQPHEYHQNQYLIHPIPTAMDTTNILPEDLKIGTSTPPYQYPCSSSSSSSLSSCAPSSSSDLYALQSPTGSMDLLSHQHQHHSV